MANPIVILLFTLYLTSPTTLPGETIVMVKSITAQDVKSCTDNLPLIKEDYTKQKYNIAGIPLSLIDINGVCLSHDRNGNYKLKSR